MYVGIYFNNFEKVPVNKNVDFLYRCPDSSSVQEGKNPFKLVVTHVVQSSERVL